MLLVAVPTLLAAWLVLHSEPASADPPGPTDYRSTVTDVTPPTEAVEVSVIGGDALFRLRVQPGHEVLVMGYDNEPYLRFRDDGAVHVNRNSAATYVNADRYGDVDLPEGVDADAPPAWQPVADDGTYAWHDHRIHWMSSQPPSGVARGSEIQRWEVSLLVDDEPVAVTGVLVFEDAVAWWPWILVVIGLVALASILGWRWRPVTVAILAAGIGCLLAVVVAGAEQLSIPTEAGRSAVVVAVPAVGLGCAASAGVLQHRWSRQGRQRRQSPYSRHRRQVGDALGLAAAAAAGGWAALRFAVFTNPVLPTDLAPALDRAGTAGALGLAIAAAVLVVTAGRQSRPVGAGSVSEPHASTPTSRIPQESHVD